MARVALVTGGTGGIGSPIARRLKEAGFQVIAAAIEHDANWSKDPQNQGIVVETVDVSDYASCEALAARIQEQYGVISVLVNNAGVTRDCQLKKMTLEQWSTVININLNSVFNVTRQFINGMLDQKWGRIINIASVNGQKGQFGQTNYSASKAGLHGFTMALAQEAARAGVTVNTISPGYTATPMVTAIRSDILDSIVSQIPMGRLAKPEEIAAAVAYLCSEDAQFISGANIPINGVQFTSF